MTRQETFDFVARALVKQGGPSVDDNFVKARPEAFCRYRGPNGNKCAAGHLIPDEKYYPEMEGCAADNPIVGAALEGLDHEFVLSLQRAHDRATEQSAWLDAWVKRMRELASLCDLSTAALDEALSERAAKLSN